MKPLKEKVSMTLDPEVVAQVRELAELSDRSLSQYVNIVLKRHIESRKKRGDKRDL